MIESIHRYMLIDIYGTQENWFIKKSLALWASGWLILNWVLGCIFAQKIYQTFDIVFYYGVSGVQYHQKQCSPKL